MKENNDFRSGVRDGIPICLGYFSVSFAFGIYSCGMGLSLTEAVLISVFNLTSAGQLAAVPIIATGGGFFELALTQLVINLRYALMSVSLSQRLGKSVRLRDRFLVAYANTDEVFAVASAQPTAVGRKYLFGLILTPPIGWTLGTTLGAAAGAILPPTLLSALGIAIYAMFIAIVVPVAKVDRKIALCALVSILMSCAFYYLPFLSAVPSGFVIIICAVVASTIFALVAPIPKDAESGREVDNV